MCLPLVPVLRLLAVMLSHVKKKQTFWTGDSYFCLISILKGVGSMFVNDNIFFINFYKRKPFNRVEIWLKPHVRNKTLTKSLLQVFFIVQYRSI